MITLQARFEDYESFKNALSCLKSSDSTSDYTAYSPTDLEELAELMPKQGSPVRLVATIGAFIGLFTFWVMCWATALIYGIVVGGKPPWSNVPFIIPAYEGTILTASIFAFFSALLFARLDVREAPPGFDPRFTRDSFGIRICCVPSNSADMRKTLEDCGAEEVNEL